MNRVDETLLALADPTRRRVVDALRKGPRSAGDLAEHVGMSMPALSRHLRLLRERGVVEQHADLGDGRMRFYSLIPRRFEELQEWLEEIASFRTGQLDTSKRHAEKKKR